jgi:4-amino-4-deoxychorismate lyase
MTLAVLINGAPPQDLSRAIPFNDRGVHYGDGLFETALLANGRIRFLDDHLQRLTTGCRRLGIAAPARHVLLDEIERVTGTQRSGVLKIIVTRGAGGRGYGAAPDLEPTRIVALYAAPEAIKSEVTLRWCETRLGRNARLAGVKHLNRLEQVLAQAEQGASTADEGLMLDTEGELVSGVASNVFIVRDGALLTPDLRFSGVRGVMRDQILRAAAQAGLAASEEPLWPHDLDAASEVFLTNAIRGVQSAVSLGALQWRAGPVAGRLRAALDL